MRAIHEVLSVMEGAGDLKLCVEGHCRKDEKDALNK